MPIVRNPSTGELVYTDDPTGYIQQGYQDPTRQELEAFARRDEFGSFEQQAQAQVERVVRGATLGAVEGFGDPEDIRAREEVSRDESPVTSFLADVAPDVGVAALTGGLGGLATGAGRAAARGALAEGAGALRAGLSAARAGGATALAAESLGTGLVGAGQAAYAEGSYLGEDLGRDAENVLLWGGLNFGLGAFGLRAARRAKPARGGVLVSEAGQELDDVARAAEVEAAAKGTPADELATETMPDLTEQEVKALNNGKGSLGALRRPGPQQKEALDSALKKVTRDDPGTLYRGMRLKEDELQSIIDDGYGVDTYTMSSPSREAAEVFAGGVDRKVPVLMQLEGTPRAAMAHGYPGDEFPNEAAAILFPGQRYKVVGVEDVALKPEKDWMQPQPGKLLRLEAEAPPAPAPTAAQKRIAEKELVEEGGISRAVINASRADAEDIVSRAIGEAPERETSGLGRQRRLYQNRTAIMDAAEREFRGDLNGAMGDLQKVVSGEKQSVIAGKVSDSPGAQRAVADGIAEQAAKFAGELRGEARAYAAASGKTGVQFPIPGAKSLAGALMDHAKAIGEAKTGKALFSALDDFKRASQEIKLSLEAGAINSTNPIHHQQLIPRIDAFERKIRDALEDSGTWGQAGEMQRAYNGVISDKLMPSLRIFEEAVMERTHRGYDGIWKMEGWENKIKGLLANTDPGRRRHAAAVFDAMDELASVRRRFGDAKTAERLSDAAAKMRRTIGLADEVAAAADTVDAMGTVAGAVPLFGGMLREAVTGRLASAVERLVGASDAAASRGVDDWIRSSRVRGGGLRARLPKLEELSPEAKQLRDVAVRRGVSQGMALFMGEDESPGAAFERQRDALISDEKFFESLNAEFGDVAEESPELYMALSGRAALARAFLIERMPPNVAVSMARPLGHPPSREAIEDWAQYVNAVRFPTRVARNLAAISVQQVETLRTVHPRFYELLQQRMIEGIARAQQTGEQLDDTFLMRAALLFPDLDGMASPVFSREFGKVVRDYNAQQRQQQGARSSDKPGKPTLSPMLSTLEHGATFGTGF